MPGKPMDEVIADLLRSLNKGQLLLLQEAIRQAGGEVRIDFAWFGSAAASPNPPLSVATDDDSVVLKVAP